MFIERLSRLKAEVYDHLRRERVLILAAVDVDAVCACKILQTLLCDDEVEHTLVAVSGRESLKEAFQKHSEQIRHVVLLNCGACLNLVDELEAADDVTFYVFDSHRPYDIINIYHSHVKLVKVDREDIDFPQPEEVLSESEEEEDDEDDVEASLSADDDDDLSEPNAKRARQTMQTRARRRRQKELWERKRADILLKYYEFFYHGTATSVLMLELARLMSKESNDLVWWAIVGLTEQLLYQRIDREKYVTDAHYLHEQFVLRLNRQNEDRRGSIHSLKLTFDQELRLSLYRHWSLYDSLLHSEYPACALKVWTQNGQKLLNEFLAEMGLPLVQCQQKYSAMDIELRSTVKEWIEKVSAKYRLDDILYMSFVAQFGYRNRFCAADIVLALTGLLERVDTRRSFMERFSEAVQGLSSRNVDVIQRGIGYGKEHQTALSGQVRQIIDMKQVLSAGPFFYAYLDESSPYIHHFQSPLLLTRLARFLQPAWAARKRSQEVPFILSAPAGQGSENCIVIGVPAAKEMAHKNYLNRAFEEAAANMKGVQVNFDSFEAAVVEMRLEDRPMFFDSLTAILES